MSNEQFIRALRWLCVLPGSFGAAVLLSVLMNAVAVGYARATPGSWAAGLLGVISSGAFGYAWVFFAAFIAPNQRRTTAVVVGSMGILWGIYYAHHFYLLGEAQKTLASAATACAAAVGVIVFFLEADNLSESDGLS